MVRIGTVGIGSARYGRDNFSFRCGWVLLGRVWCGKVRYGRVTF